MAAAECELEETAPGKLAARGPLTFATARSARASGLAALNASGARDIQIDCSGITASDSAGLSVLLDWLAIAGSAGRSLRFESLPAAVRALARISDVLELLERGV